MSDLITSTARLESSRASLRQVFNVRKTQLEIAKKERETGPLGVWRQRLKSIPGASVIIDAVAGWWAQHPMRFVAPVAAASLDAIMRPVARRNPIALVFVAVVLGAVFAWARPWRWILRPALFAGLLPRIVSRAVGRVPTSSWTTLVNFASQSLKQGVRRFIK